MCTHIRKYKNDKIMERKKKKKTAALWFGFADVFCNHVLTNALDFPNACVTNGSAVLILQNLSFYSWGLLCGCSVSFGWDFPTAETVRLSYEFYPL
jgi:hypothetical protein